MLEVLLIRNHKDVLLLVYAMATDQQLDAYRDFSQASPDACCYLAAGAAPANNSNGSHSEQNFPVKLHYLLEDMESDGLGHIVSWQPHGRCFIVHKPKQIESVLAL